MISSCVFSCCFQYSIYQFDLQLNSFLTKIHGLIIPVLVLLMRKKMCVVWEKSFSLQVFKFFFSSELFQGKDFLIKKMGWHFWFFYWLNFSIKTSLKTSVNLLLPLLIVLMILWISLLLKRLIFPLSFFSSNYILEDSNILPNTLIHSGVFVTICRYLLFIGCMGSKV